MSELEALGRKDWDALIEEDNPKTRMTLRAALRRSLYLVTKLIVAYTVDRNLMTADTYKERQEWLQNVVTTSKRGLLEDPRSFIKSTGCTRSIPVWLALQRPNEMLDHPSEIARALCFLTDHPHLRGVDNRIVVCGDSKRNATRFTGSVKTIFETNPVLRWAFPELLWPSYQRVAYGHWTDEEFSLPGRFAVDSPDEFVRAAGLETKIVGGRADVVIFNDLVGDDNWRSPTEIAKRREFIKTGPAILEVRDPKDPYGGVIIVEGNRWTLDYVNSMIHDEYTTWDIWRRGVYRCYVHGTGNCGRWGSDAARECAPTQESLWKERYPDADSLKRLEADVASPEIWAAQYLNDPTTASELDAGNFVPFDVRVGVWKDDASGETIRGYVASIGGDKEASGEVIPLVALARHVVSVDVASSTDPKACRTSVTWMALDKPTGRHLWLDCRADRWAPDRAVIEALDLGEEIVRMTGAWPRFIIEKVAAQTYFATALSFLAKQRGHRLNPDQVELIPPARGVAKEDRIKRAFGHLLGQRRLLLRAGLQLPRAEVRHFPTGSLDTLDSATQAILYYQDKLGGTSNGEKLRQSRLRARDRRLAASDDTGAPIC